ncbi:MAG: nickel pincer cofactor biosynthesis protein LarC [Gemmataceae bacterium]|nr:nickel pincer cofactor biosynthesis protein LarC [Gemmataceae bacterium]
MRTLHFDCFNGISGDMTVAALADAGADRPAILAAVASLGLPVAVEFQSVKKGGLAATYFAVRAEPEQKHRHLHHIEKIIAGSSLKEPEQTLALRIFRRLAEAEAAVHGTTVDKVHFHEVGAADSIVDIVATAVAYLSLGIERVTSRSVPPGSGTVKCDHGVMPVPAPATAHLLTGVPLASSPIAGELTTPTGAAILTTLVDEWTESPAMTIAKIGVGAGTKEFPGLPNVLRVFVGEAAGAGQDAVWVLETNLDDVTGETLGYAQERLFHAGALDAYVIPMLMKKGRPGFLLGAIVGDDRVAEVEAAIFRETGTLGVRRHRAARTTQPRAAETVDTPWGPVRIKRTRQGASPEYDDCALIAREHGLALTEVTDRVARLAGP